MTDAPGNGNTLAYRVGQAEKGIDRLWSAKADGRDVDRLGDKVRMLDEGKADKDRVEELRDDMRSVRRALYAVAGSVLVGAILFALAFTQGTSP